MKATAHPLRTARKRLDLNQEELARMARLNRAYIAQIETGARRPSSEAAVRIAGVLQVSVDDLFGDHAYEVQRSDIQPDGSVKATWPRYNIARAQTVGGLAATEFAALVEQIVEVLADKNLSVGDSFVVLDKVHHELSRMIEPNALKVAEIFNKEVTSCK